MEIVKASGTDISDTSKIKKLSKYEQTCEDGASVEIKVQCSFLNKGSLSFI